MRLVNSRYNIDLNLQENQINILVIEKPEFFQDIVQNLYQQSMGIEGDFILSEADSELSIGKNLSLLIDPFSLDFNDKKIMNKIYSELVNYATELFCEKENINSEVIGLLDTIICMSQYDNLSFNLELDWLQLMKLYNIHIDVGTTNIYEKMLEYEKIVANVMHHRILVYVNAKTYLEREELRNLYQMASYYKLQLLLVEPFESIKLDLEKIIILDTDRCIISK